MLRIQYKPPYKSQSTDPLYDATLRRRYEELWLPYGRRGFGGVWVSEMWD